MKNILVAFGTRPEVIKLSPVILELQDEFEVTVLHTGQHRELVEPMLALFGVEPDIKLDIMQPGQDLFDLTRKMLPKIKDTLQKTVPDYVMVQGDTTTSYLTALAAFYLKIPVLHVEAGLRSHDPYYPFPEEMNRKQITHLSQFHFAPTETNKSNLLDEGVPEESILVTGNTVIDALQHIQHSKNYSNSAPSILSRVRPDQKLAVLTAHRRENHGEPLQQIFRACNELLNRHKDLVCIFPSHPNPKVQEALMESDMSHTRFLQTDSLDYLSFLHVLNRADLILTDSGGIQEEGAALGKPILVLRGETERQELIEAGLGELVGTETSKIVERAEALLKKDQHNKSSNIFGDGEASKKIRSFLKDQL